MRTDPRSLEGAGPRQTSSSSRIQTTQVRRFSVFRISQLDAQHAATRWRRTSEAMEHLERRRGMLTFSLSHLDPLLPRPPVFASRASPLLPLFLSSQDFHLTFLYSLLVRSHSVSEPFTTSQRNDLPPNPHLVLPTTSLFLLRRQRPNLLQLFFLSISLPTRSPSQHVYSLNRLRVPRPGMDGRSDQGSETETNRGWVLGELVRDWKERSCPWR